MTQFQGDSVVVLLIVISFILAKISIQIEKQEEKK